MFLLRLHWVYSTEIRPEGLIHRIEKIPGTEKIGSNPNPFVRRPNVGPAGEYIHIEVPTNNVPIGQIKEIKK